MFAIEAMSTLPFPVDILSFLPQEEIHSCMQMRTGERRIYRATIKQEKACLIRTVDSYFVEKEGLRALDRTIFEIDEHHFIEKEQYRSQQGKNLLEKPIVLPRFLGAGDFYPFAGLGFSIHCLFYGTIMLRFAENTHQCKAMALCGRSTEHRFVQWFGAGIGALALGPRQDFFDRWVIGWRKKGVQIGEIPNFAFPALPMNDQNQPRTSIF